ncbi:hypothetical protein GALMADRAFT_238427 [Galerina marginata CBS 339.88]|uniref:Large ribosomal subunit protein uL29m n=1 Tax=Galerina marginata (strain CBS 339.88) TaxID=685588 RepID=A0A067TI46_GALM3|nr:hypothetical protein GALMADRAFT_238427 [Galerina marginata CBS 339.88]
MLSLTRNASKQVSRPLTRSLAEVVTPNAKGDFSSRPPDFARPQKPKLSKKIPVREDHGLYAFFRRKPDAGLVGEERFEVVETPESGQLITGRAWEASELRNKSFKDLHTLWYISLREKNLLATQKEEARRMGVNHVELQVSMEKVRHCRKTMARIKMVLNERRLAYEGAMKIAAKEQAMKQANEYTEEDKKILEHLRAKLLASRASHTITV